MTTHIVNYSKLTTEFLNNLEKYIPLLINSNCQTFLDKITYNEYIASSIILYGTDVKYLLIIAYDIIKRLFNLENIQIFTNNDEDNEYKYSNYHFELDFSEKNIEILKSMIQTKNVINNKNICIIKNTTNIHLIKNIIDNNTNTIFIILTPSLSKIDNSIISRSTNINAYFPIDKIYTIVKQITNYDFDFEECKKLYYENNMSIIALLIQCELGFTKLKIYEYFDQIMNKILIKKSKEYDNIMLIREFIYKLIHVTFPFKNLCLYIIKKYKDHKKISDIVKIIADNEFELIETSKEIFIYEKFFINLMHILL